MLLFVGAGALVSYSSWDVGYKEQRQNKSETGHGELKPVDDAPGAEGDDDATDAWP